VQFFDLGTAWNGKYNGITRPGEYYTNGIVSVRIDAGGLGPFAGGYGFGMRSTLLGYFLRVDAGWPMKGVFKRTTRLVFFTRLRLLINSDFGYYSFSSLGSTGSLS
jgi:hypothetical protein